MKKVYKPEDPSDWSGILWPGNTSQVPRDASKCENGDLCMEGVTDLPSSLTAIIVLIFSIIFVAIVLIPCIILVRKYKYERELKEIFHKRIDWCELKKVDEGRRSSSIRRRRNKSRDIMIYQELPVKVEIAARDFFDIKDRSVLVELKHMIDIRHENIASFIGICYKTPNVLIVTQATVRGSLSDIIAEDDSMIMDWDFKISIINDIVNGMKYLHHSAIEFHGCLTSASCLVSARWICKICCHGLKQVRCQIKEQQPCALLWAAPEILKQTDDHLNITTYYQKADVYSFAIILQEIILECPPYGVNVSNVEAEEILNNVKEQRSVPFRPFIPVDSCSTDWTDLMTWCWQDQPDCRPPFTRIHCCIKGITKGRTLNIVTSLINRLTLHTTSLEDKVTHRTKDLQNEKSKLETVLCELLPQSVAITLMSGQNPQPETFDEITVFFSDIVGFTRISSQGSPMEIVCMLNNMYTLFDDIAKAFDVYKVCTIGDAYMVASGVPTRNGDIHAVEICKMALALLESIKVFPIDHLPGENLHMRIGIHSGPCAAGVAGIKTPRYLLFGNTVDIVEQIEAAGKPMKIQISNSTAILIKDCCHFRVKRRHHIRIKGNGKLLMFWLKPVRD